MKNKSLILAAIVAIPTTLAMTMESASAQIIFQRPIGRAYALPVTPSASPAFVEDSNGDSIADLSIVKLPLPKFEFNILTELNGQPIIDQENSPNLGFFPNAISPFAYIVDTDFSSERLKDDQGNFLPSTQEEEIIEQIIPGIPRVSFEGNLIAERLTLGNSGLDLGIIYEFSSEEDSISFLLPLDATINFVSVSDSFLDIDFDINPQINPIVDSFLATNSLDYIVNQNLFGQEAFLQELILLDVSFNVNTQVGATTFKEDQAESSIIFASQSVPEPNNIVSLLTLGFIGINIFAKRKIRKS